MTAAVRLCDVVSHDVLPCECSITLCFAVYEYEGLYLHMPNIFTDLPGLCSNSDLDRIQNTSSRGRADYVRSGTCVNCRSTCRKIHSRRSPQRFPVHMFHVSGYRDTTAVYGLSSRRRWCRHAISERSPARTRTLVREIAAGRRFFDCSLLNPTHTVNMTSRQGAIILSHSDLVFIVFRRLRLRVL